MDEVPKGKTLRANSLNEGAVGKLYCVLVMGWYPAHYKIEIYLAHGPDYQHVTSKVFTFCYLYLYNMQ